MDITTRMDLVSFVEACEEVPTLDEYLKHKLSLEQQSLYAKLLERRSCDATTKFPVNLVHLMDSLEVTDKSMAVKRLTSDFMRNQDFEVSRLKTENSRGGRPIDHYYLSEDAAKTFALGTKTQMGQLVRRFFVDVVNHVQDFHVVQLQFHNLQKTRQLQEENRRVEEEKQALEEQNRALSARLDAKYVPSQIIYVIRNQGLPDKELVKIGISGNFKNRKGNYKTSMPHGVTTEFWLHCIDASLCEKIVNRVLEEFCFNGSEWFQLDMSMATSCITAVVAFVDGLITNLEAFAETKSHERIEQLFEEFPQDARSTLSRASLTERITDTLRAPVKRTRKIASTITQYFKRGSDSAEEEQASSPNVGTSRSHSEGNPTNGALRNSLAPPQENDSVIDGWLETHLERSGDGRVHLHRLIKALGEFQSETGRVNFPTPSSAVVCEKLRVLGYELTKSSERQRDSLCYCRTTDRYVKFAALK